MYVYKLLRRQEVRCYSFIEQYFEGVHTMKLNPQVLQNKLKNQKSIPSSVKEDHGFYGYKIGKVKNPSLLSQFNIDDPNSEICIQNTDFYLQNAATCFHQEALQLFFNKQFTIQQLQNAILQSTSDGNQKLNQYKPLAKARVPLFMKRYNVLQDYAYCCCLALSYYSGSQSQRVSRNSNIIIKLHIQKPDNQTKDTPQYNNMLCIAQWLFRALNCIPLHWGKVTRCVSLKSEQYQSYQVGNIVTWLQFSSSSYGALSEYFAARNTRFFIYSLSGRCVQDFSNYGKAQSQVLFKPFSHFVIMKRERVNQKQFIYMREIFIGQSKQTVLWVDDKIFDEKWENKKIMEIAMVKDPLLCIIPKVSTECALAFLKSAVGSNRKKSQFRIISDMTRNNQKPSYNAGSRFVSACQKLKLKYDILIFTSDQAKAEKMLNELSVSLSQVKISVYTQEALKFLNFK